MPRHASPHIDNEGPECLRRFRVRIATNNTRDDDAILEIETTDPGRALDEAAKRIQASRATYLHTITSVRDLGPVDAEKAVTEALR